MCAAIWLAIQELPMSHLGPGDEVALLGAELRLFCVCIRPFALFSLPPWPCPFHFNFKHIGFKQYLFRAALPRIFIWKY